MYIILTVNESEKAKVIESYFHFLKYILYNNNTHFIYLFFIYLSCSLILFSYNDFI